MSGRRRPGAPTAPGRVVQRLCVAVAIALSVAVAACGDDGKEGTGDALPRVDATAPADTQIRALLTVMRERFNAGDGQGYCALLSAAGRGQVVALGRPLGFGASCATVVARLADIAHKAKSPQQPVRIISMKVADEEAVVRAAGGTVGPRPGSLRFVETADGWKASDLGFAPTR
jgi:hypothetical protein